MIILTSSCMDVKNAVIDNSYPYAGKTKKELILNYGIPYKEFKTEGLDIVQFRSDCYRNKNESYCYIREYFLDEGKAVKFLNRWEYYDPSAPNIDNSRKNQ